MPYLGRHPSKGLPPYANLLFHVKRAASRSETPQDSTASEALRGSRHRTRANGDGMHNERSFWASVTRRTGISYKERKCPQLIRCAPTPARGALGKTVAVFLYQRVPFIWAFREQTRVTQVTPQQAQQFSTHVRCCRQTLLEATSHLSDSSGFHMAGKFSYGWKVGESRSCKRANLDVRSPSLLP